VKRAISGAEAAGMRVTRVELDPATGRIVLLTDAIRSAAITRSDALDRWLGAQDNAKT